MSDVSAQAFREAAAYFAHLAAGERRMKDDLGKRTAADMQRYADLLLAAAEQREQLDELMSERVAFRAKAEQILEEHETELCPEDMGCKDYIAWLQKQIATLTAERDDALDQIRVLHTDNYLLSDTNVTLTAERDEARALLADFKLHLT